MRRWQALALVIAGTAALLLKLHYAHASAHALSWILAPTTALVELVSGHAFGSSDGGYVNHELRFVIAPACAGVNFLIAAWLALVLTRPRLPLLPLHALLAYAAALVANALRITLAIAYPVSPLLHQIEGAIVYLAILMLLFVLVQRRALLVPLACYLGVTLVIPLLNGGWQRPAFWLHAAIVACVTAITAASGYRWRRAGGSHQPACG